MTMVDQEMIRHVDMLLPMLADPLTMLPVAAAPHGAAMRTLSKDLTSTECASLLKGLIACYTSPEFKAQLRRAFSSPAAAMQAVPTIVLRTQAPVLTKHGLPASPQSFEHIKSAVHRRIAEGATDVQRLGAPCTRSSLGSSCVRLPVRSPFCALALLPSGVVCRPQPTRRGARSASSPSATCAASAQRRCSRARRPTFIQYARRDTLRGSAAAARWPWQRGGSASACV
jgi:hypothetical protein